MDESSAKRLPYLRRGSDKKMRQYCLDSNGFILHVCAIHGHCGGNKVDLSLLDNVEIPYMWNEYIYHVDLSLDLHYLINNAVQPDWLHLSRWFFSGLQFYYQIPSHCRRKRYERRKTNGILHSRGSCEPTPEGWTLWRDTSATSQNWMESVPERRKLNPFEKRSGKRTSILANPIQCYYPSSPCASRLSRKSAEYQTQKASSLPRPPPKGKGCLASSTRRWSPSWNQYSATCCGRGKDGT